MTHISLDINMYMIRVYFVLCITYGFVHCVDDSAKLWTNGELTTPKTVETSSANSENDERETVCRGTKEGINHVDDVNVRYNLLKSRYTNCTYVDGNLELVFLPKGDYSFLSDIKEVTGYVLIVASFVDYFPLTKLRIIRGRTLFSTKADEQRHYSLYIALNYNTDLDREEGLKELRFNSLHEILDGDVKIFQNHFLCLVDKINWKDIVTGENAQVSMEENSPNDECKPCSQTCSPFEGVRHCWGSLPENCQKLTKLNCSLQCDSRCFGYLPNQCCHPECAGGCEGPAKSECWACKNFYNHPNCEHYCPPETIYSPRYYKNIPNKDFKYIYGSLCVDKCPPHLMVDGGACVQDCGAGRMAGKNGKCVPCDGPCPKTCKLDTVKFINSETIKQYEGCTVVQGSIRILTSVFENDDYYHIKGLQPSELSVLETIQEVTDYVQVQATSVHFNNLSFLKNLRVIHGQKLASGASLQIFRTSLQNLGLDSLSEIRFGTVFIANNTRLCYADSVNWTSITREAKQRVIVEYNRAHLDCVRDNEVCSEECSKDGCWGPHDYQCLSCVNHVFENRCLKSCDSTTGAYLAGTNLCKRCDPECKANCTGEGPDKCHNCKNARDGPYCVSKCPLSKYKDEYGVCQLCHENCDGGCTGPRNTVGPGACNSCALVEMIDGSTVSSCLPMGTECSDGFYSVVLPSHYSSRSLAGKQACIKCHPLCETCIGSGLTFCTKCKHYKEDGTCVAHCSFDHFAVNSTCEKCDSRCLSCYGPDPTDCIACKEYKLYEDSPDNDKFICTDECPAELPHAVKNVIEIDGGLFREEIVCSAENPELVRRNKYMVAGGLGGAALLLISIIASIVFCLKCRRSNHIKQKLTDKMTGAVDKEEPMEPSEATPDIANMILINQDDLLIGECIGTGAFGSVYKGYWKLPDRQPLPVAIKVLRDGTHPSQTKELLEEARIMASVNHPCCSKILAMCIVENVMLVTNLLPRGCMLEYIRKNAGCIGSESLLRWCQQIASGMDYLESKKIVHRDLAARNVLVESSKQVKITDFGLAKLLVDDSLIKFNGGKMPIKWLAIECLTERIFNHKSDVWSYGVTIWEMTTLGRRPYEDMKTVDIPKYLEKGERLEKPQLCSEPLYNIMRTCWDIEPNNRPTFKALMGEFEDMMKNPEHYIHLPRYDQRPSSDSESMRHHSHRRRSGNHAQSDPYLEPKKSGRLSSGSSAHRRVPEVSDDEELNDDVFQSRNALEMTSYLPMSPYQRETEPQQYLVMSPNGHGTNGYSPKYGYIQHPMNMNTTSAVGSVTPVWQRRTPNTGDTVLGEDDYHNEYVAPQLPSPQLQHVDLLDGHLPPTYEAGKPAGRHFFDDSLHQKNPSLPPRLTVKIDNSQRYRPLPTDNDIYTSRKRNGSHDLPDTDISSSTLECSEPDYYNDFDFPNSAAPLVHNAESPV